MTFWTDDRLTMLNDGVGAGISAGVMAGRLGCSRNAVLGKLHRLGLKLGRKPVIAKDRVPRKRPQRTISGPVMFPAPIAAASPPPTAEPAGRHRCDLLGLRNTSCRWPVTDLPPHMFCGEPQADFAGGVPYCPWHSRMAHARANDMSVEGRAVLSAKAMKRNLESGRVILTAGIRPIDPRTLE